MMFPKVRGKNLSYELELIVSTMIFMTGFSAFYNHIQGRILQSQTSREFSPAPNDIYIRSVPLRQRLFSFYVRQV